MDAIRASAAAATPATDTSSTGAAKTGATEAKKSFATLFAEAKGDLKSGEKLTKVDGHQFARIKGGSRDDMCINLSGNARSGQAFDLVWRDGRQFHVYGGKGEHTVVEVGKKAATTDATKTTDATTTPTDSTKTPTDSTKTTPDATSDESATSATPPAHA